MKTAKRLLTAALAVVFTFMCALPAMADDTTPADPKYTLTIDNPAAGHTYKAYQIFDGYHTKDGTSDYLSDINWGSGITRDEDRQAKMIGELKKADRSCAGQPSARTGRRPAWAVYARPL